MTYELAGSVGGDDTAQQTIVFLGSLGSDRSMWQPQMADLGADHRVIALDVRGHGESPTPAGPYTVPDLADDVLTTLVALGAGTVHLVGLSLGGAIAQQIALVAPERVSTMTLLCTSARFGEPQPWLDRAATVRASGTSAIADAVVERWFTLGLADEDRDLVDRARAMVKATDDEGYAACCEALAEWDSRPQLPSVTTATLAIAGAQDPATPPEHLQLIADLIPGARIEILDPGAHLVNLEQAAVVSSLIREHVATR
ncbi:3-oxoadipate enol-lactonase [Williamsia sp. 1138]|uniref:3-oxoadipate enol-lactonase n=1 Tax=Williamsia sp. 1138 TaxID=1903117 RepID=UPI000A10BCFC|nr:3-oxoadipate enol-lactonase [Williamsia sp. 1138]OZG26606.1 3-oxoadipate enol-lactonase [Williamsia sp. 1138]